MTDLVKEYLRILRDAHPRDKEGYMRWLGGLDHLWRSMSEEEQQSVNDWLVAEDGRP